MRRGRRVEHGLSRAFGQLQISPGIWGFADPAWWSDRGFSVMCQDSGPEVSSKKEVLLLFVSVCLSFVAGSGG